VTVFGSVLIDPAAARDLDIAVGYRTTAERDVVLPLDESEAGRYATRQMSPMLEFMETDWLRRLDLELLASSDAETH